MFQLSLKEFLNKLELQKEKAKDYRNVVLIQLVLVVSGLLLYEPLLEDSKSEISKLIITTFSLFGAIYAFLLWDLLRNFTDSKILIAGILAMLAGIVIAGVLVEFPYYQIIQVNDRQAYLFILHGVLFPIEITVIGFAIRDLFSAGFITSDKLWGAACVFLMVGISFGSLYDLITIVRPGSLGVEIEPGLPTYSECVTYSFSVLGGIDSDLKPTRLIKNISIIESVWGTLYAMLIIGKLLSLPRIENENKNQ
jgi:asparagine N-glycosylation enzyme membrane subunit Stt3